MRDYTLTVEDSNLRFLLQMRNMRVLGMALAGLCIAAALRDARSPALWAALVLMATAWPYAAHRRARLAADPVRAEYPNLIVDAALGGFWVAVMGFNLLPSVVLMSMLWLSEVATAGLKFWLRCVAVQLCVALATFVALDPPLAIASDMVVVVACLPLLLIYPIALSALLRKLSEKVRRQKRLLERLVCTDGLTGLANRQHWEWCAEQQLVRVARGECVAAMLMIDVDDFKAVNDRYGHLLGDEVLATVAGALRASVREGDIVGRYAGDEFALVMPGAGEAAAAAVAERFRAAVSGLRFPGAPTFHCTVSIGLAVLDAPVPDVADWIHRADQAMYRSKRGGRDRVTVHAPAPATDEAPALILPLPLPRRAG